MTEIIRCNSEHPEFVRLVALLDMELASRDGAEHAFYAQFNGIDLLAHVVLLKQDGEVTACGAFKLIHSTQAEVKRMYVDPAHRGKGYASRILSELAKWGAEVGLKSFVLETGLRQFEAIALYQKSGYGPIDNYGPYVGVENSRCFQKHLIPS